MPNLPRLLFQQASPEGLIEVFQQDRLRWLSVDSVEQSRISIDQPGHLLSPMHHALLSGLMFVDAPDRVLLAGLGGGAIARYLHKKEPGMRGDAVEINATIVELASRYFSFPDAQWNAVVADIRQWQGCCYDLIVADIADAGLTPAWLTSEKMIAELRQQLSAGGVLAMNLLVEDGPSLSRALAKIREIFERRTLCLAVPEHRNVVVLAFNQRPHYQSMEELSALVPGLTGIWGLDFGSLLKQLLTDNPVGSGIF